MTRDRWQQVRELFEAALERGAGDPVAWVNSEKGADPAVRAEVLSLLDHHSRAGSFLAGPLIERMPELLVEDEPLPQGTVVGSYTIVRELGRGGMGRVYLASDQRLARTVALKALAPHLTRDPSHRERLRREARAAAALTHPGICTVYALEEIGDDLFIATEYVDGLTLREEIASGRRPSAAAAVESAHELSAALASAHAKGVVHRDLKPENVMRTADGRLKILDFGLARLEAQSASMPAHMTAPGVMIGTPAYMAPEQINGQPVDARTDVFAFGVLMYEYICGVHPFEASTELAQLARVLESDARAVEDRCPRVPATLARVIDRCLRKRPAERFASGGEILDVISRESSIEPLRRTMTWWRTHQAAVIALYAVAAATTWEIKESFAGSVPLWLFVVLGVGTAIGGIVRGHLLFTDWMNRRRLASEQRRTRRAAAVSDLLVAGALFADGLVVASTQPLWAVLTMALAVGIALAAIMMEPVTTAAALGQDVEARIGR
jgi:serine/threonine protein kinase